MEGVVNAVAPKPATNAEFSRELAQALGRPSFLRVPKIALKLALGDMSEVVLGSQRVVPEAALRSGYSFRYPELGPALRQIVSVKG